MFGMNGKNNFALVMANAIDDTATDQIQAMIDSPVFAGSRIRIMADTHAGKGSVVGFTATLTDRVVPNVVGVDIGCGIEAYRIDNRPIDFAELDRRIRELIPSGFSVNSEDAVEADDFDIEAISAKVFNGDTQKMNRARLAIGSLGGGNHFIEIDRDAEGCHWLLIHSGSRSFGLAVCNYHQAKARQLMKTMLVYGIPDDLAFLPMDLGGAEYLEDMRRAQEYAVINRHVMAARILGECFGLDADAVEAIKTVHNYIGLDNIIRKGAISAYEGERVLIPINMRDGVIIGRGKGSEKWNNSAPHGAGRVMGRKEAKRKLSVDDYRATMAGVWSSCVGEQTLDEAPDAYKPMAQIMDAIGEVVEVEQVIKPVYNFKAVE